MSDHERVFVRFKGRTIGPFPPEKIKEMIKRGQVTRMHELSGDGLSWSKADEFGNFFPPKPSMHSAEMAAGSSQVPPGAEGMGMDGGGAMPAPNEDASATWYAHVNNEKQGPVSMDQMRLWVEAKILKKDSLVWKNGMGDWQPASQVLPQLFGGGAPAAGGQAGGQPGGGSITPGSPAMSSSGDGGDGGALVTEMSKHHSLLLTTAITLILIGVIFFVAQMMNINRGGKKLKSDYMNAAVKISLGGALLIVGAMGIQTATKLKEAAETSSTVAGILAAKSMNQLWIAATVATVSWLLILILVCIAAAATEVPVLKILAVVLRH